MAGFMSMFGENYSLCFCWRYVQEFGQMGIEYMAQIWKQFQPEIWQRLTPRLCFICGRNQFLGGMLLFTVWEKNLSFLIILSFGKINKKMICAWNLRVYMLKV